MIAVIGAGWAGLSAGSFLQEAGHRVIVFEKSRGRGGRSATRRHHELAFDHGAQYFTVTQKRFRQQVHQWQKDRLVAPWDIYVAELPQRTRAPSEKRLVGVPSMNAPAKHLAESLELKTRWQVERIEGKPGSWELVGPAREGPFEAVLVTTPPEQACPLLTPAPALASLAESIESLPCWAVMVTFPEELPVEFEAAWVNQGPLKWVAANHSKPGRPRPVSWVLHATSAWSLEHLEETPAQVGAALVEAFLEACQNPMVDPEDVLAHRWRLARPNKTLGRDFLWDPNLRLGAAGDWCATKVNLEQAYLSGLSLGQAVFSTL